MKTYVQQQACFSSILSFSRFIPVRFDHSCCTTPFTNISSWRKKSTMKTYADTIQYAYATMHRIWVHGSGHFSPRKWGKVVRDPLLQTGRKVEQHRQNDDERVRRGWSSSILCTSQLSWRTLTSNNGGTCSIHYNAEPQTVELLRLLPSISSVVTERWQNCATVKICLRRLSLKQKTETTNYHQNLWHGLQSMKHWSCALHGETWCEHVVAKSSKSSRNWKVFSSVSRCRIHESCWRRSTFCDQISDCAGRVGHYEFWWRIHAFVTDKVDTRKEIIRNNTRIGSVLNAWLNEHCGRHGVEAKIDSLAQDGSPYWVVISRSVLEKDSSEDPISLAK